MPLTKQKIIMPIWTSFLVKPHHWSTNSIRHSSGRIVHPNPSPLKHFQVSSQITQHSQDSSINYTSLHVWEPKHKSIAARLISLTPILHSPFSNFRCIKEDLWRPSHLLWHLESVSVAHCYSNPIYNHKPECRVFCWNSLLYRFLWRNGKTTAVNLIWGISSSAIVALQI